MYSMNGILDNLFYLGTIINTLMWDIVTKAFHTLINVVITLSTMPDPIRAPNLGGRFKCLIEKFVVQVVRDFARIFN